MHGPSTASPPSTRFPSSPESSPEQGTPEQHPLATHRQRTHEQPSAPPQDSASDVVRWAAFSCVLVPVVLVGYGGSLAGATGAALGLVAVTGVCRVLLRQSERGAARLLAEQNRGHRGRHGRTGVGAHRGTRQSADGAPLD
ncbi:hypothetical protein [Streptomyces sp. Je 1-369]|uniref:hypothetical protein n=1 Tax=Streptomyces sp. Je 1-369 TaxID=2966192 RepID=UPI002AA2B66D|nr:hypothetical protein [Streptomyces sp. Je 1-369]